MGLEIGHFYVYSMGELFSTVRPYVSIPWRACPSAYIHFGSNGGHAMTSSNDKPQNHATGEETNQRRPNRDLQDTQADGQSRRVFFFSKATSRYATRGHSMKLFQPALNKILNCRKQFFTKRFINHWKVLPTHVVNAKTVNAFINRSDNYWSKLDMESKRLTYSLNYIYYSIKP